MKAIEKKDKEEKIKAVGVDSIHQKFLVPLEVYLAHQIHLGTKVISPDMRQYIFRRKADGIAVFNTTLIDSKINEAIKFLCKFNPEDIVVTCKREEGWYAVEKFSEITGIKTFVRKYPAGIITNPNLEGFFEPELVFVVDPWQDRNAIKDAKHVNCKIMAVCTSSSRTSGIDFVLPSNNRNSLSLGLLFYLLAQGYLQKKGIKKKFNLEDFIRPEDATLLNEMKKRTKQRIVSVKRKITK